MLAYKIQKQRSARVVTCMTPHLFTKKRMDLCFIPKHDRPKLLDSVFVTLGPPNTAVFSGKHDTEKGLILVGGVDKKSHIWNSESIISQIEFIINSEKSKKWTISTSPRTPDKTIVMLEKLAYENPMVQFIRYDNTSDGWIENAYLKNYRVWVTADSVSMIYEALTAGCSVGVLPVNWKRKNNKFKYGIDFLVKEKLLTTYDIWISEKCEIKNKMPLDEASRCAKEILKRWWPDRLK
mmetsp:Transcript_1025/g.797  ORF Transcript_1025/g.797 Transcript_1025/m.797 type:complete len:237 (-) Transcript_1025:2114-2824(-)